MKFGTIMGVAFAALALVLAFVVGMSLLEFPDDPVFNKRFVTDKDEADVRSGSYVRKSFYFFSDEIKLHAWAYYPDASRHPNPTTIVFAHGALLQKDFRLSPIAERLTSAGYALFTFDYRGFGGSDGYPRHVINPTDQLTDLFNAIDFVLDYLPNVNKEEVGLWGASLGGGHVAMAAATYPRRQLIKSVVTIDALVDGWAATKNAVKTTSLHQLFVTFGFACRDLIRRAAKLPPSYLPIFKDEDTEEGTPALLPALDGKRFEALLPVDRDSTLGGWKNLIAAASLFKFPLYRPISHASDIKAPVLVIVSESDAIVPPESQRAFAAAVPNGKGRVQELKTAKHNDWIVARFDRVFDLAVAFTRETLPIYTK